ncbi:hypothetical protein [Microvirga antarctica]|uniref:hypothetical protein n=1 Tax=Microvirga antarctica TaxID=2819233 RepID=UPI001B306E31|nr:hypothetical protein [Microvirga antarctica]
MKMFAMFLGTSLAVLGSIGAASAQPNPIQGTPGSLFPNAAPNEVQIINGVPCRTILVQGSNVRVPVECAGPIATRMFDPSTTGSIRVDETAGRSLSGTPGSLFPYAAPNEVQIINGMPCRTVLVPGSNERVAVECAR